MQQQQYETLTANTPGPFIEGDQYRFGNSAWKTIAKVDRSAANISGWLEYNTNAEARRPITHQSLIWIRSQDRKPTEADLPIQVKQTDICLIFTKGLGICLESNPFLWQHYKEPAMPAPTQDEIDDKAFKDHWCSQPFYGRNESAYEVARLRWHAALKWARSQKS